VQSIVSINQIGLAVWGWLSGGALISYEIATRGTSLTPNLNPTSPKGRSIRSRSDSSVSKLVEVAVFSLIGFLIAFPPFLNDVNWRKGLESRSFDQLQHAAIKWPYDQVRMNSIALIFEGNGFSKEAREIVEKAIEINPDSFDSWKALSVLATTTPEEKANAIAQMRRIDPRNVDLK
jgi:hypothetical protein